MLKRVSEGELLPRWFYGYAGYDVLKRQAKFLPIPLNLLYRQWQRVQYRWDGWRGYPSRYLLISHADVDRMRQIAYDQGRYDGERGETHSILGALMKVIHVDRG